MKNIQYLSRHLIHLLSGGRNNVKLWQMNKEYVRHDVLEACDGPA